LLFCRITGARPYDLLNARIECFNGKKSELRLEETSLTGRAITPRTIPISDDARKILREAIGDRKTGLIFLTITGKPWAIVRLSMTFVKTRAKAGVSPEVVLSGRGGNVSKQLEAKDDSASKRGGTPA